MRTVSSLKNFQKILRTAEALLILEIDLWFSTRCQGLRHESRNAKLQSRKFGSNHFYWCLFHQINTSPEMWINHLNQLQQLQPMRLRLLQQHGILKGLIPLYFVPLLHHHQQQSLHVIMCILEHLHHSNKMARIKIIFWMKYNSQIL